MLESYQNLVIKLVEEGFTSQSAEVIGCCLIGCAFAIIGALFYYLLVSLLTNCIMSNYFVVFYEDFSYSTHCGFASAKRLEKIKKKYKRSIADILIFDDKQTMYLYLSSNMECLNYKPFNKPYDKIYKG